MWTVNHLDVNTEFQRTIPSLMIQTLSGDLGFLVTQSWGVWIDPNTGLFWLADVGQDLWEEINLWKKEATTVGNIEKELMSRSQEVADGITEAQS